MTKHRVILSGLGVIATLALWNPGLALASGSSSASDDGKSSVTLDKTKLEQRAAKVSAEERAETDAKLAEQAKKIDARATTSGNAAVVARLSKEFGVSADALAKEREKFETGWGQLMIAHTLQARAKSGTTADQLLALRREGMGWGEIAAGLGLSLGKTMSAVNAESRMALEKEKDDDQAERMERAEAKESAHGANEEHERAASAAAHGSLGLGRGHR
jgi:hypothetical protein